MLKTLTKDPKDIIADFVNGYSIELTRRGYEKNPAILSALPQGTRVFLPFLPGARFEDVVPFAKAVRAAGLEPVPHLAARRIESREQFVDVLGALRDEAHISHALCIAGDPDETAGPFKSSMELLETGLLEPAGLKTLFLAGHPEGNPAITPSEIWDAVAWKNEYNRHSTANLSLVTQFSLDPRAILEWERALSDHGNELPVFVGVPGPTKLSTLIKYAQACGIGASARMLMKYGANITKLAASRAPDAIVAQLAEHIHMAGASQIAGLHVYTFGGAAGAIDWLEAVKRAEIKINRKKDGFDVMA